MGTGRPWYDPLRKPADPFQKYQVSQLFAVLNLIARVLFSEVFSIPVSVFFVKDLDQDFTVCS
jgi:hypothetical protein